MTLKTGIRTLFLILATVAVFSGCSRRQPIYRVTDQPIPAASRNLPAAALQQTIMEAATDRGWLVDWKAPGELLATKAWKEHEAVVEIRYSHESYTIDHVSTTNLLEQGESVHRAYNKLVRALEDEIERRLRQTKN
ncbi:hypothetical protein [Azospirillum brasilense]|uniref:Lipoprotein n=1 Tax=Azospirillum brasilense TaxID=192 RepID=A0A235H6Y6_AZOBR|nr:hypothetical protein [Azospirillum brasilense]OYD81620.1 hypothetical protein CHT98_25145 [Azospirillum brasilense]